MRAYVRKYIFIPFIPTRAAKFRLHSSIIAPLGCIPSVLHVNPRSTFPSFRQWFRQGFRFRVHKYIQTPGSPYPLCLGVKLRARSLSLNSRRAQMPAVGIQGRRTSNKDDQSRAIKGIDRPAASIIDRPSRVTGSCPERRALKRHAAVSLAPDKYGELTSSRCTADIG